MAISVDELRAKYEWISGFTFTVVAVNSLMPEEALRTVVPSPTVEPGPGEEIRSWAASESKASVADAERVGDWTLLTSASLTTISRGRRLAALSQNGRVVSLISSDVAPSKFQLFEGGELRRQTEPALVTDLRANAWVGEPLPEEEDLPFETVAGLGVPSACEVFERLTGIAIRDRLFVGSLAVGV